MSFAGLPLALVIAGAVLTAGVVVTLYLLKSTPRAQPVSNIDFWIKAVEQAKPSWVFSTRVPLIAMLLTLLAALLLVVLAGDPHLQDERAITTVAVLDAGRTMSVVGADGKTRSEHAAQLLRDLATQSTRGGHFAVVRAGLAPSVLVPLTDSATAVESALDSHQPDHGPSDLDGAIALADQIIAHRPTSDESRIVVITDHHPTSTSLQAPLWIVPVGEAGETVAIVALGARRDPSALGEYGVYCEVRAFTKSAARARLVLRDHEVVLAEEEIELDPGESVVHRTRGFSSDVSEITAELENITIEEGQDALTLDDRAVAVVEPLVRTKVLVVTQGNRFLEAVLRVNPSVEFSSVAPLEYDPVRAAAAYDVVILDHILPGGQLRHPGLLLIAPPERRDELRLGPRIRDAEVTATLSTHPVLDAVELEGVHFRTSQVLLPDPTDRPLFRSQRNVLATARETNGQRRIVFGFDLRNTDLVESPAFPLLMHNAVVWLANQQQLARSSRHPGEPLRFGGQRRRIELPGGGRRDGRGGSFFGTSVAGLYRVEDHPYAVSAVDFAGPLPAPSQAARAETIVSDSPIGLWIALSLLALLIVEWFLLHRGRV